MLEALPRRPVDGAYTLRNTGDNKVVYKLNAVTKDDDGGPGVLVRRGAELEFQSGSQPCL